MCITSRSYLFSVCFLFSNVLFAGEMGLVVNPPYDGIYIGGNIGVANLIDKERTDIPVFDQHHLSSTGIIGGGVVGYDYTLSGNYKLGFEGFINATSLNASATENYAPTSRYTASMQYDAGFRLLPGYEISPGTVGHLILGYSYGRFNISDNGDFGIIDSTFSKNGFQPGLGILTALTPNLSIRGDLIYTTYASQTSWGVTPDAGSQIYHNSFATLEGDLALVYKFS